MPQTHPSRSPRRHRLSVASRTVAAFLGAYALAALADALLALALPLPRQEAVVAAALVAFAIVPAAALWAFAARTAGRAWLGLLIPGLVMALIVCILRGRAA